MALYPSRTPNLSYYFCFICLVAVVTQTVQAAQSHAPLCLGCLRTELPRNNHDDFVEYGKLPWGRGVEGSGEYSWTA